jgi:pantoate--beta-alanine ligase
MTMGALHDGHAALLRAARAECATVIATIFVNPLQFGAGEDLERYPRPLNADIELAAGEGVEMIYAPHALEVYPDGAPQVLIDPGELGTLYEGALRPGHFAGVLTVVAKLLHATGAERAYFGEKDYQQLTLIHAMVRDLGFPAQVVAVPTVRAHDGLALSSRNAYLTSEEHAQALGLSRALRVAADAGPRGAEALLGAAALLLKEHHIEPDYLALTDPQMRPLGVGEAPTGVREARLLVAARVGGTRLIDNTSVYVGGE